MKTVKLYFVFIFYCGLVNTAVAQVQHPVNPEKAPRKLWAHDYAGDYAGPGGTDSKDWPLDIKQTSDGGYISCGYANDINGTLNCAGATGNNQVVPNIIKLDANGNKLWGKNFNPTNLKRGEFNEIIELEDHSGYAVIGDLEMYDGVSACWNKTYFVKIDWDGNIIEEKIIGFTSTNDQYWSKGSSISEDNNGFIVGGSVKVNGQGDLMMLHLDYNGDPDWQASFDPAGVGADDLGCTVRPLWDDGSGNPPFTNQDGSHGSHLTGYAIAGTILSSAITHGGYYDDSEIDLWVAETDNAGNIAWSKTYDSQTDGAGLNYIYTTSNSCMDLGKTYSDWAMNVIQTSDDYIMVAAGFNFETGYVDPNCSLDDSRTYDCFLIKFERSTGNIVNGFPTNVGHFSGDDSQTDVRETQDNGFVINGSTADLNVVDPNWGEECLLVKTDVNGAVEWSRTYHNNGDFVNGPGMCCFSVFATKDGGYIMCGNNNNDGDNHDFIKTGGECQRLSISDDTQWNNGTDIYMGEEISGYEDWDSDRKVQGIVRVQQYGHLHIYNAATIQFADSRQTMDCDYLHANSFPAAGISIEQPTLIIVEPGGELIIDDDVTLTSLSDCDGSMWDGIQVRGDPAAIQNNTNGGKCTISGNAHIQNARMGVMADIGVYSINGIVNPTENGGGGILQIDGVTFTNCRRSVHFAPYLFHANPWFNNCYVKNSYFYCTGPMADASYNGAGVNSFISNNHSNGILFDNNWFENSYSALPAYARGTAIISHEANGTISNNQIYNLTNGIDIANYSAVFSGVNIHDNSIDNTLNGIFIGGATGAHVGDNNIITNVPDHGIGILCDGATAFKIKHNNVSTAGTGRNWGSVVRNSGTLYSMLGPYNTFTSLTVGTQTQQGNDQLQIRCNDYTGIGHAWAISPKFFSNGTLPDQGTNCDPVSGERAGNKFNDNPCAGTQHILSNVNFTYYYFQQANMEPLCYSSPALSPYPCGSGDPNECANYDIFIVESSDALMDWEDEDNVQIKMKYFTETLNYYIDTDTTGTDSLALDLLKRLNTAQAWKILVQAYYYRGEYSHAQDYLDSLTSQEMYAEFTTMFQLLVNMGSDITIYEMDDDTKQIISAIADSGEEDQVIAQAIMSTAFGNEYLFTPDSIDETSERMAEHQIINQNALDLLIVQPNPFTKQTTVTLTIPERTTRTQIIVTDVMGETVNKFETAETGNYQMIFDAKGLIQNIYFVNVLMDGKLAAYEKIMLIR